MDHTSHSLLMVSELRRLCGQLGNKALTSHGLLQVIVCSALFSSIFMATQAEAREVIVYDSSSLHRALRLAKPGDDIVLYPGSYRGIKTESPNGRWHYFYSHRSGTASSPITVRSYSRNDLQVLYGDSVNSAGYVFYLTGNHWRIRDLKFHTGQKGIMLDSASRNILDNVAVYNVRDEGVHFRQSSSSNILRNCLIYNTGRLKPGFGEAVYVGTHNGDKLRDHSNNNRIGGCQFGPGVTAEAIDIKAGTVNTIVEYNVMNGRDISGVNYADSFIDIKGDRVFVRHNRMHWLGNKRIDHGIHVLKRRHNRSNMYQNTVTLGNGMPFLKIGRGTVHAKNNRLNYNGKLAKTYSKGAVDSKLDSSLPAIHRYTGFQRAVVEPEAEPETQPDTKNCLRLNRDKKVEVNLSIHSCIDFPVSLSRRLLQVWDSNVNKSCNFRGSVVATKTGTKWSISANYAGTRKLTGNRVRIRPSNRCQFLIMRWL